MIGDTKSCRVTENKMAAGAIGPRRPLPSEKGIRDGCDKNRG
jgi:hypothetical protein